MIELIKSVLIQTNQILNGIGHYKNQCIKKENVKSYLLCGPMMSSSSTKKGKANSQSSKSSWKDNLLELLEKEIRGELLEENLTPESPPVSSFPRENNYIKNIIYKHSQKKTQ